MSNDIKNKNFDDDRLRKLFRKELPDAPRSLWFTRKVMNRLPERRGRAVSILEIVVGVIAAIVLVAYWIGFYRSIASSQVITVGDVCFVAVLMIMTLSLVGVFAVSVFRRV